MSYRNVYQEESGRQYYGSLVFADQVDALRVGLGASSPDKYVETVRYPEPNDTPEGAEDVSRDHT